MDQLGKNMLVKERITCVRRLRFDAGHRVMNHESKCATCHGHGYVIFIHAEAPKLDDIGRVIDFSVLKQKVGTWIDDNWDHTMILYKEDKETIDLLKKAPAYKDVYLMPTNPTAENMAEYLLKEICPKVLNGTGVRVRKVVVWETENCYAEAVLDYEEAR